ncbi:tlde1 domain-containing protein [Erwinia aphidicola]|uniref:tlde1 domain-containing protein n=1 Tax=Erwinia aphidicola TaxID=68334 RepID=UPI0030CDC213
MTWEYSQGTGVLRHNGSIVARGYSGVGSGLNAPSMQQVERVGPIPEGFYRINGYNNHRGPYTVILDPIAGTNTFGRSAFRIHGDNASKPPNSSSEGCIVINDAGIRQSILNSGDSILRVVP